VYSPSRYLDFAFLHGKRHVRESHLFGNVIGRGAGNGDQSTFRLRRFAGMGKRNPRSPGLVGIVAPLFPIPPATLPPPPPYSSPHPFRFEEAAPPVRAGCGHGAIRTQGTSLPGPERKSDKAPAIITDGAKKWRRGTDG